MPWSIHEGKSCCIKEKILGFSYAYNIANFEAFRWKFLLSSNLFFSKEWVCYLMTSITAIIKLLYAYHILLIIAFLSFKNQNIRILLLLLS